MMKLIEQSYEILSIPENALQEIERAARTCYKSEDKITDGSAEKLVKRLIEKGHHAMIELGGVLKVKFITNRGVTHELVRHRLCSFAQESTRYCNYGGDDIIFIKPVWLGSIMQDTGSSIFHHACLKAEEKYKRLLIAGWTPQQAREVLPNALKTEIVVQANLREWRHIFKMRCDKAAHPQIRELMLTLLSEVAWKIPVIFDDIVYNINKKCSKEQDSDS